MWPVYLCLCALTLSCPGSVVSSVRQAGRRESSVCCVSGLFALLSVFLQVGCGSGSRGAGALEARERGVKGQRSGGLKSGRKLHARGSTEGSDAGGGASKGALSLNGGERSRAEAKMAGELLSSSLDGSEDSDTRVKARSLGNEERTGGGVKMAEELLSSSLNGSEGSDTGFKAHSLDNKESSGAMAGELSSSLDGSDAGVEARSLDDRESSEAGAKMAIELSSSINSGDTGVKVHSLDDGESSGAAVNVARELSSSLDDSDPPSLDSSSDACEGGDAGDGGGGGEGVGDGGGGGGGGREDHTPKREGPGTGSGGWRSAGNSVAFSLSVDSGNRENSRPGLARSLLPLPDPATRLSKIPIRSSSVPAFAFNKKIPSYQVGGSTVRNKYANIKSRVDQSDPNPAHKLQNTVKDLTVDSEEGRQINPRFSKQKFTPSPSSLIQRRKTTDFNDRFPLSTCHTRSSPLADYSLQKSQSFESTFSRRPLPRSVDCTYPLGGRKKLGKMSSFDEHRRFPQSSHRSTAFETIEEDETGVAATADSTELTRKAAPQQQAFSASTQEYRVPPTTTTASEMTETGSDGPNGVGVSGMEITNSGSETTVVLQHILALSASRSSSNSSNSSSGSTASKKRVSPLTSPHHHSSMAIIEEDEIEEEEDYFESPDTPQTPLTPLTPMTPTTAKVYTLAHPIPRLLVTDEGGELVETVVENSTVFTGSILPAVSVSPPPSAGFLHHTIEEEEELESINLSTRL